MTAPRCTCPACNLVFEPSRSEGTVACPVCDTRFIPPTAAPATAPLPPPAPMPVSKPYSRAAFLIVALLTGGIGLAVWRPVDGPSRHQVAGAPPAPVREPVPARPPLEVRPPVPVREPIPARPRESVQVRPVELPPPAPVVTKLSLSQKVNRAIDRGYALLRQCAQSLRQPQRYEGLLGLTLLECGAAPTDPLIEWIASSLSTQAGQLAQTYELATAIFFFDRLGKRSDDELIRLFADRLVAGQEAGGTWTYRCPLTDLLTAPSPLRQPAWRAGGNRRPARVPFVLGDHSNTQFATLALWIARRHGAGPQVEEALGRVNTHFRQVQGTDGSWSYRPQGGGWRTSNTCAGLLALAVGHGIDRGRGVAAGFRLANDPAVRAALAYLGKSISGGPPAPRSLRIAALDAHGDLYALWSIERVGALYGLKRIGNREWYPWAAEWLVQAQRPDGSWQYGFGEIVDTCFALLILRRTNLAPDLTKALGAPTAPPALPKALRTPTAPPGGDPRRGLRGSSPADPGLRRGLAEPAAPALPHQRRLSQ